MGLGLCAILVLYLRVTSLSQDLLREALTLESEIESSCPIRLEGHFSLQSDLSLKDESHLL